MKLSFDVDCTPEELREFFGLPDVKPMQEALMKEVEAKLRANIAALDPEAMLKTWLPAGFEGFEKWREMFMAGLRRERPQVRHVLSRFTAPAPSG